MNRRGDVSARGLSTLMGAEIVASAIGFLTLIHLARRLGPSSFAELEFATLLAATMLVWVRGGVESIALREASRSRRLIGRWTACLIVAKFALALMTFAIVAGVAVRTSAPATVLAAGLILFPSAILTDLGPRVSGRLGWVAMAQLVRAVVMASVVVCLVQTREHVVLAAGCATIAETSAALFLLWVHRRTFASRRSHVPIRAIVILFRRGMVSSVSRFGRVVLFAIDMLVLGWMAPTPSMGSYAAARRVVFAIVAIVMIFPAASAPSIARAFVESTSAARNAITSSMHRMMSLILPASLGLILTSRGWMGVLFGDEFGGGGLALAVIAARLPILLFSMVNLTALVAVREERQALTNITMGCGLAAILVPVGAIAFGPIGAGVSLLGVELTLAARSWTSLGKIGIAPSVLPMDRATLMGCLAMLFVVTMIEDRPVWMASVAGASIYVMIWILGQASLREFTTKFRRGLAR